MDGVTNCNCLKDYRKTSRLCSRCQGNQSQLPEALIDYFEVAITANPPEISQMQSHQDMGAGHRHIQTRHFLFLKLLEYLKRESSI